MPALAHRLLFMMVLAAVPGCSSTTSSTTTRSIDAANLKETDVVPVAGESIQPSRNYVYCATFQLAWDQLKELNAGPIRFTAPPQLALLLNRETFNSDDVSPESSFIFADRWRPGIRDDIERGRDARFPKASLSISDIPDVPKGYVAYAYLVKTLEFDAAFDRCGKALNFGEPAKSTRVRSFGFDQDVGHSPEQQSGLARQVEILSFTNSDDFIIELKSKSAGDELILAKLTPGKTLLETIRLVNDRIRQRPTDADERTWRVGREPLQVPLIQFNVHRRYSELELANAARNRALNAVGRVRILVSGWTS